MKYKKENLIYELLEITPQNEIELNYLITFSKILKVYDKVKIALINNTPIVDYKENKRQSFGNFYKEIILSEILYRLLELIAINIMFPIKESINNITKEELKLRENKIEKLIEEQNILIKDFSLYYYDKFLDEKNENQLIKYLLKTDLSPYFIDNEEDLSIRLKDLYTKFYNDNKDYFNI
jgi:hypothetical protein